LDSLPLGHSTLPPSMIYWRKLLESALESFYSPSSSFRQTFEAIAAKRFELRRRYFFARNLNEEGRREILYGKLRSCVIWSCSFGSSSSKGGSSQVCSWGPSRWIRLNLSVPSSRLVGLACSINTERRQRILVQLDPEARLGRQLEYSVAGRRRGTGEMSPTGSLLGRDARARIAQNTLT
jgi:hypothetical protein